MDGALNAAAAEVVTFKLCMNTSEKLKPWCLGGVTCNMDTFAQYDCRGTTPSEYQKKRISMCPTCIYGSVSSNPTISVNFYLSALVVNGLLRLTLPTHTF